MRAISWKGRSPRPAPTLERSERQLVAYAQAQGIINTSVGEDGKPAGDTNSLQGESLIALNKALAEATARRVAAEGAYRSGIAVGATADVTASTQAAAPVARGARGGISGKAHADEAGSSGHAQPALADR